MRRLASSLAKRTHRVRPSEKTPFSVVPGPFPARQAGLGSASSRRGGLRTPAGKALDEPERCLLSTAGSS